MRISHTPVDITVSWSGRNHKSRIEKCLKFTDVESDDTWIVLEGYWKDAKNDPIDFRVEFPYDQAELLLHFAKSQHATTLQKLDELSKE
jgi:hypothetical protein